MDTHLRPHHVASLTFCGLPVDERCLAIGERGTVTRWCALCRERASAWGTLPGTLHRLADWAAATPGAAALGMLLRGLAESGHGGLRGLDLSTEEAWIALSLLAEPDLEQDSALQIARRALYSAMSRVAPLLSQLRPVPAAAAAWRAIARVDVHGRDRWLVEADEIEARSAARVRRRGSV